MGTRGGIGDLCIPGEVLARGPSHHRGHSGNSGKTGAGTMSCFGRTAAVDRPTDFKAAMRSLDAERKRAKILSAALKMQHDYVAQLEDAALCLEKTLSAFPDGDFQLTLVAGLRKKQRMEFDAKMSKLGVDQHMFHDDPTGQHEASEKAHRRPSFLESARKRASAIFNSHAKGKEQLHQRASDRAREQRERLERRLQAPPG